MFLLTGSGTIDNIAADPGRSITLVFGGACMLSSAGNIVNGPLTSTGNTKVHLTSLGGSWFLDKVNT